MYCMNSYDIVEAARHFEDDPVLGPASQTLLNLLRWTDENSDGWAHWPKPCRAAERLQRFVDAHHPWRRGDVGYEPPTAADYRKTLAPIKAFRTRQGADFEIVEA